jgi:biopolymer transport protein ExbB
MELAIKAVAVFQKGGPVMYLLLLCSLIVAAIGVERFLYYKENRTDTQALLEQITPALERDDWEAALAACRQASGVAAKVAAKGIQGFLRGSLHIESMLEGEAALAAARLRENLNHLDTIVTIAPLLGLLGTVIGMIGSFSVLNVKTGQPLAITGGVGEALVATAAGLCVATLSMVIYSYFSHRLDTMITDLEEMCTVIIGQVKRGERP